MAITINSDAAKLSQLPDLQQAVTQASKLGFMPILLYRVKELPGFLVAALVHKEPSVAANLFFSESDNQSVCAVTTFFTDGSSHSVVNFGSPAPPPDPHNFVMPMPGGELSALLDMHMNTRKMGATEVINATNFVSLAEKCMENVINHLRNAGSGADSQVNPFAHVQGMMAAIDNMIDEDEELVEEFGKWRDEVVGDVEFDDEDTEDTPEDKIITEPAPDMTVLDDELELLESWWQKNDPELTSLLNPACSDEDIAAIEAKLDGLKLPLDILHLYKWHNGLDDDSMSCQVGADGSFATLEAALETRNLNIEALGDVWDPAWLPIMGDGESGLFVRLNPERLSHSGIYQYDVNTDPVTLHYANALGMVQTWRHGYEQKVFLPTDQQGDDYYEVFYGDAPTAIRQKFTPASYPFVKKEELTYFDWPDLD